MSGWIKPQTCDTSACLEVMTWGKHRVRMRASGDEENEIMLSREELAEFVKSAKAGQYDSIVGL